MDERYLRLQKCLQDFSNRVDELEREDDPAGNGFTRLFRELRELGQRQREENAFPATEGKKTHNIKKNRYKDIIPFDDTRVTLEEISDEPGSDYINANFVEDPAGKRVYIAAQGPLPKTVDDFWRMLCQYKVKVIIMACKEVEMGKRKCEPYWPENVNEEKDFGEISVTMVKCEHWTAADSQQTEKNCIERVLKARKGNQCREIRQFQYIGWPDHDIPDDIDVIIEMMVKMRKIRYNDPDGAPAVIHCSAGCGRTGTICAIDYAWDVLKLGTMDEKFDLHAIVRRMREQRQSMIQAPEQYEMAYKAVKQLFDEHLEMMEDHDYSNWTPPNLAGSQQGEVQVGERKMSRILLKDVEETLKNYQEETKESKAHVTEPLTIMDAPLRSGNTGLVSSGNQGLPEPIKPSVVSPSPPRTVKSSTENQGKVLQAATSGHHQEPLSPIVKDMKAKFEKTEKTEETKRVGPAEKKPVIAAKKPSPQLQQKKGAVSEAPAASRPPAGRSHSDAPHISVIQIGQPARAQTLPANTHRNENVKVYKDEEIPGIKKDQQPPQATPSSYYNVNVNVNPLASSKPSEANTSVPVSNQKKVNTILKGDGIYSEVDEGSGSHSGSQAGSQGQQQANFYSAAYDPTIPGADESNLYAAVKPQSGGHPLRPARKKQNSTETYEQVSFEKQNGQQGNEDVPVIPERRYLEETTMPQTQNKEAGESKIGMFKKLFSDFIPGKGGNTSGNVDSSNHSNIPGFGKRNSKKVKGPRSPPESWAADKPRR